MDIDQIVREQGTEAQRLIYPYAVKMLGPREFWPSLSDHFYLCLIEQFCDAALQMLKDPQVLSLTKTP